MAEQTPDNIITTQRNGQTIVAELFFNHSSTETDVYKRQMIRPCCNGSAPRAM